MIFNRLKYDSTFKIRCKLSMNEIMNVLDLCLDNTYLLVCFCKTFCCQIFGVTMSLPISVIMTNVVGVYQK